MKVVLSHFLKVVAFASIITITTHADRSIAGTWADLRLDEDRAWLPEELSNTDSVHALAAPSFRVAIDEGHGAEIVALETFDGMTWQPLIEPGDGSFPSLSVSLGGDNGKVMVQSGRAKLVNRHIGPSEAVLQFVVPLVFADESHSGLNATLLYEVFPEGGVFVRLGLIGWPTQPIHEASVALRLGRHALDAQHYRDDQLAESKIVAVPAARVALGWSDHRSYTNEIEALVESAKPLVGSQSYTADKGNYQWLLGRWNGDPLHSDNHDTQRALPDELRRAPVLYYNRLALAVTNSPYASGRSTCIGERIFHWVNFLDLGPDQWYPTDDELNRMKRAGATMLILHHEYLNQRGSNGDPPADYAWFRDRDELVRCVRTAKSLGIRVGLYLRGIERYALDEPWWPELIDLGVNGVYIDWHGAHAIAFHESRTRADAALGDRHFSADGSVAPARDVFAYTRQLRELIGPRGFIITHLGAFNSGVLANLGVDGFTVGETASEHALFSSEEGAAYVGMMGGSVVMPWPEEAAAFNQPSAPAKMAAWGFYPHMILGMNKSSTGLFPRDPLSERTAIVEPYWQLLGLIRNRRDLRALNTPADAVVVVETTHEAMRAIVYQEKSGDLVMLVANLSNETAAGRVKLKPTLFHDSAVWSLYHPDREAGPISSPIKPIDGAVEVSLKPWGIAAITVRSSNEPTLLP